jgi:Protein of unknown function (DUF2530)
VSTEDPPPMASDTARLVEIGMACWFIALVISMLVPALHQGDRAWWPWTCVAGIAGGALALGYVRRGRGNAAGADLSARSRRASDGPASSS